MRSVAEDIASRSYQAYRAEMESIADQLHLPGDALFRRMPERMKGNFYVYYPHLFSHYYPTVRGNDLDMLTLAGNLYFTYLLIFDELIDGDAKTCSLPILHLLHERALEALFLIFPADSPFWNMFKEYRSQFLAVSGFERGMSALYLNGEETDKQVRAIAENKSAFAKCATAGLLTLVGDAGGADPFVETQNRFHAGLQLMDDLEDWKEDYLKGRPSCLLCSVLSDARLRKAMQDRPGDEIGILGRFIYFSGAAGETLAAAKTAFERSLESCKRYDIPLWKDLVGRTLLKAEGLEQDIAKTKSLLLAKRETSHRMHEKDPACLSELRKHLDGFPLADPLSRAAGYLIVEQEGGYPEMTHRMAVPGSPEKSDGNFPVDASGNIFQRTMVLETFLDFNSMRQEIIDDKIVANELDFVERSRVTTVRGGWSYFPGYRLLPPDSDDLAQVVRIAARTKSTGMRHFIDDAVSLLILSNRYADGTFHTWILDPNDHGSEQEALRTAVASYWGERSGKDIEVTSNLASALSDYDPEKYREVVRSATEAVIGARTGEGTWPGVWYCGRYYGTYAAVRLLSGTEPGRHVLARTYDFLVENQSVDGGWGERGSDPLNTSFAVLSLCCMRGLVPERAGADLNRAVSYLVGTQRPRGSWEPVPFINMYIGGKKIIYRSETLTTALVVRALMAIIRNGGPQIIREFHE